MSVGKRRLVALQGEAQEDGWAGPALDEQIGEALQEEHHWRVGADQLVEAEPDLRERLRALERQPNDRDVPRRPEVADGRWDFF